MRLRKLLIAMAALLGLAAIAVVAFVATFDANRYKPELVELVRERTGRELTIDGELSLALWPRVGLSVGPARLSGPGGRGEFAQFDSARIGVALWPLLARRVVADRLMVDGLKLEIVRRRDGSTNLDDLLRKDGGGAQAAKPAPDAVAGAAGATAAAVTVAGVQLRNANLGWRDEAAGTEWRLQQAEFETGALASGRRDSARLSGRLIAKRPLVDAMLELAADYTVDFATLATQLADLDLRLRGQVPTAPQLDAHLRGNVEADPASGRLALADLKLDARSGDGIEAQVDAPALAISRGDASGKPIGARVRMTRDGQRVDATLSLAAPTRDKGRIVIGEVKAEAKVTGPQLPADGVKLSLAGDGSVDPERETATLAFTGRADDSALQARVSATRFAPLALRYELQADRIDVDRYRGVPAPGASGTAESGTTPRGAGDAPAAGGAPADAIPVPPIADLDTSGTLRVGALKLAGVAANSVTATIRSGQGRIELTRLDAGVWRGKLDATASLSRQGRHALRARLDGVDAGMALRDLSGRDLLEGRGNLRIDVAGGGQTIAALKRSLDGTAAIALRDGAIKGVDLAELLRRVRQAAAAARGAGPAVEQRASGSEQTAFSSLDASFAIRDGIAHNDDLDLRSPLLRVGGSGKLDLTSETIDYVARVSVVGTLAGQGGAELAALRGVTVPVRLTGPFASLSYRVDVAGLAIDAARQELTRRLQEKLLGKPAAEPAEPAKPSKPGPRELLEGLLRR